MSVCVSVCPRAYIGTAGPIFANFCAHPAWPWLGPAVAALRYVMYFRFYGWRHIWPYWAVLRCVESRTFNLLPLAALRYRGGVWCLWMPCYSATVVVWCIVINLSVCVSVCVSVCPRAYLGNHSTDPQHVLYLYPLWPWFGRPPTALHGCTTLCTSGFMDDVTFGCSGRYAERWRLHSATAINGVAIPGRSVMSMNACLFCSEVWVAITV